MAPSSAPPPRWNAALGVWDGDRAAGADFVPPDPLYIFGYGSLCYKRDELPSDEEFVGRVRGWRRLFAQSSTSPRRSSSTCSVAAICCPSTATWAATSASQNCTPRV